jgi:hypothetical protein
MDHFAGLDVSVKETSVCILDDAGMLKELTSFDHLSPRRSSAGMSRTQHRSLC